jgi:hypothetical protein
VPLADLPYRPAALIWDAVLIAAIAGTAMILSALTGLPSIVVGAVLAFIDGACIIPNGQLTPIVLLGLATAAYGLTRERPYLVFIGAALAMLEPHIGLPACGAIFVWRPGLRLGLIGVAAALAGTSILILGLPVNIEYLRAALPAQAQAESTTAIQYSLAWLLHYFGASDAQAIRAASVQYAAFAVASIVFAGRVAGRLRSPAALALSPAAVAVIGGPYVHLNHIAAAIPFALLLAARRDGIAGAGVWIAIALLAVPWPNSGLLALESGAIITTVVLWVTRSERIDVVAGIALVSLLLYAGIAGPIMERFVPDAPRHLDAAPLPARPSALDGDWLASQEDAREARRDADFAISTPRTLARKVPVWLALCALVVLGCAGIPKSAPAAVIAVA